MFGASLLQRTSLRNALYLLDVNENTCSSQNLLLVLHVVTCGCGRLPALEPSELQGRQRGEKKRNQIFSDIVGPWNQAFLKASQSTFGLVS